MGSITPTGTLTLAVRANLSINHVLGAALLAADCLPLERDYTWPATDDVMLRHGTSAVGAIILAASALEAAANEFHLDAVDNQPPLLGKAASGAKTIAALWDTVERGPTLRKFQWFLQLAGCEPLNPGLPMYQAAADVIELRDALVHFKPEWTTDPSTNKKLEARLKGKFPLNPLSKPDQLFVPYRCLGFGSGAWAARSVHAFLELFANTLELPARWAKAGIRIEKILAGRKGVRLE